jgi:hypothetical protein
MSRRRWSRRRDVGHLALHDLPGEPFGDGGLAHAGVADEERVVLAAAAEDLDAALHLLLAADEGVHVALAGLGVQVDAVLGQRALLVVGESDLSLSSFLEESAPLTGRDSPKAGSLATPWAMKFTAS